VQNFVPLSAVVRELSRFTIHGAAGCCLELRAPAEVRTVTVTVFTTAPRSECVDTISEASIQFCLNSGSGGGEIVSEGELTHTSH